MIEGNAHSEKDRCCRVGHYIILFRIYNRVHCFMKDMCLQ